MAVEPTTSTNSTVTCLSCWRAGDRRALCSASSRRSGASAVSTTASPSDRPLPFERGDGRGELCRPVVHRWVADSRAYEKRPGPSAKAAEARRAGGAERGADRISAKSRIYPSTVLRIASAQAVTPASTGDTAGASGRATPAPRATHRPSDNPPHAPARSLRFRRFGSLPARASRPRPAEPVAPAGAARARGPRRRHRRQLLAAARARPRRRPRLARRRRRPALRRPGRPGRRRGRRRARLGPGDAGALAARPRPRHHARPGRARPERGRVAGPVRGDPRAVRERRLRRRLGRARALVRRPRRAGRLRQRLARPRDRPQRRPLAGRDPLGR